MNTRKIGLIGYGHLGQAIHERADEVGIDLEITEGRGHNAELAAESETLILTVRPEQVTEVLDEIRERLSDETSIISFAAACDSHKIRKRLGRKHTSNIVRAMTDINLRQMIAIYNRDTEDLLRALSKNELLTGYSDSDIMRFTVYVGCLPGVAAWQFANNAEQAEQWLRGYQGHIEASIQVEYHETGQIIDEVRQAGNYHDTVKKVATKGGVTEALIQALEAGNSDYSYLHDAGYERIEEIESRL